MQSLVTRCLVCGSERLHYLLSVSGNRVVRCDDCHLLLTNPQPSSEELIQKIEEVDITPATPPFRAIHSDFCLVLLERYYGSRTGNLLQLGWLPQLELSAAERGFTIPARSGQISDLPAEGIYDICVIFNELGRSRAPRELLASIHRLLRPDGVIFIITLSVESKRESLSKTRFEADQLFYFRGSDLQSLLLSCGFGRILEGVDPENRSDVLIHMARKQEPLPFQKLSIVVPVFNEAQTFTAAFEKLLAKRIEGLEIEIVLVESNSSDGTREQVKRYQDHPRVKVIFEERARGKGHAIRTGLKQITGDFVVIQDADLEYDLEDYEALLEPLRRSQAAFVLGARHGGSAWKMRQFNNQPVIAAVLNLAHWVFTALINVGFSAHLKNPFTMYKVFRRDCLYGIRFECNRFDFDWELVIKFLRKGYEPMEIPVNYRSRSFAEGKKVSFFRDPLTWLRVLVKLWFSDFDALEEVERDRRQKAERQNAMTRQGALAQ